MNNTRRGLRKKPADIKTMPMKKLLTLLLTTLVVAGCDNKKSAEELFKETASGVVVVLNEYYYELKLPNGNALYFTGLDEDGDIDGLTPDVDEAKANRNMLTGTAFFIDDKGTLLTNRHVAKPDIDAVTARRSMINIMKLLKQYFAEAMSTLSQQYDMLESQKSSCQYVDFYGFVHVDQNKLAEINSQQMELSRQFNTLKESSNEIDNNIDPEGIKITTVCEIGIAYNDTYVTTDKDFIEKNPCVVVRTSDKEDVDLALLQLKNKKTPENTYTFKMRGEGGSGNVLSGIFSGSKADEPLTIDQQLYMIGYNAGLVLANTKQGIKVQMTSGKVTQMPDGQRLLYSIPTLQGSSGSPVIDEYGNLVAVNFAKLGTTDNFNFGIPEERIREFLKR